MGNKTGNTKKYNSILKHIGPGFLLAGAAIGVSHLVQATRAGANYGFALVWALAIACISKYPFLEFGPRYAAATGDDLITGYKKLGKFVYRAYIFITIGTMFVIQASVTIVTAGLSEQLFGLGFSTFVWSLIILGVCILLLLLGKYQGLDLSMKFIIVFLTLVTVIAVVIAFGAGRMRNISHATVPSYWNSAGIAFLIAFMGWMPIPIDTSVWHSLWTKEKASANKQQLSVKNSFVDFNIGYISASLMGLLFLSLGALVMFGTGNSFSNKGVIFSKQLISMYRKILGPWSSELVSIAAFITMMSTTLTVTDAYPRVFAKLFQSSNGEQKAQKISPENIYRTALFIIPIFSLIILYGVGNSFTYLVDFASGLSFLSAPFLAWFNFRLATHSDMPKAARPGKAYRIFSWICFLVLVFLGIVYLYMAIF